MVLHLFTINLPRIYLNSTGTTVSYLYTESINLSYMKLSLFVCLLLLMSACHGPESGIQSNDKDQPITDNSIADGEPRIIPYWSITHVLASLNYANKPADLQYGRFIRRVFEDSKGQYWIGTNEEGVCRFRNNEEKYFTTNDGLSGNSVRAIAEDKTGNLWFATNKGVSKYDGRSFTQFTTRDGLPSNDVWSLLTDSHGNTWFGTAAGACRFDGRIMEIFPVTVLAAAYPTRFTAGLVWSMLEDRFGNIWLGTDGSGVYKYDGKEMRSYTSQQGLAGNNILSLLEDKEGNIWMGTWKNGLIRFDGTHFTNYTQKEGLTNNDIWSLTQDTNGNIWIGTLGGGINYFNGKTFGNIQETEGITNNSVQQVFFDHKGILWIGYQGGLFKMEGRKLINYLREGC